MADGTKGLALLLYCPLLVILFYAGCSLSSLRPATGYNFLKGVAVLFGLFAAFFLYVLVYRAVCIESDFGAFVIREAQRYGGRTNSQAALPQVNGRWKVKRDRNGFQAWVTSVNFTNVDAFMHQAFGKPKLSSDGPDTATGQPHRVGGASDIGVAIHLIGRTNGAEIICVRAMRDTTEAIREMDRSWWKFW